MGSGTNGAARTARRALFALAVAASLVVPAGSAVAAAGRTATDVAPPKVDVVIDDGAATTEDPSLRVAITATDAGAGSLVMRVGSGPTGTTISLGDPQPYDPSITIRIAAGSPYGSYTVVVDVADESANTTEASDAIDFVFASRTTTTLAPSYRLIANLDYAAARLTTTETVTITNRSDQPIGFVNFSVLARAFGELVIGAGTTVDGHAVNPTYPNSAELRVPLATNLMPGDAATLVIPFVATASTSVSDSLRARFAKVVDTNGVVMMQVSSWYPLLSTDHGLRYPGDSQMSVAAPVTLTLDRPTTVVVSGIAKSLKIAAPGVVSTAASSVPGRTITTVKLDAARELAFAASPRFATASTTTTRTNALGHLIKVTSYYLPGESGSTAAANAKSVLDTLTASYGAYPYDRFVVARSARSASGNEYSGMVFLGSSKLGSKYSTAHETAHQWFYGLVGNDQLEAPWLDEGFAEYTARLAIGMAMPSYCSSLPVDSSVYAFPNKPADSTCNGYNQTIYYKACAMLAGVRSRLGGTAFRAAVREIVATFRGKVVTEQDVVAIFEKHASNPKALDKYMYSGFLTR